jgi:hypothetical protein
MAKLREIVPGIRDHIAPNGRVTVELRDDRTGKLRYREQKDNAIASWYLDAIADVFRVSPDYFLFGRADGVATDYAFNRGVDIARRINEGRYQWAGNSHFNVFGTYSRVWYSTNTVAIDPDVGWIPGSVVGACATRQPETHPNLNIGSITSAYQDSDVSSISCEWHTTRGNGTFQTVGTGAVMPDQRTSGNSHRILSGGTYSTGNWTTTHLHQNWDLGALYVGTNNGFVPPFSAAALNYHSIAITPAQWFMKQANGSMVVATPTDIVANNQNLWFPTAYTVTNANLGTPNTTYNGITTHDGKLWIISGTNVWRNYNLPIASATPTVNANGTFTGFTDTGVIDICSDGTSIYILGQTKVFVFNPATQAITSSWDHNLTEFASKTTTTASIAFDPKTQMLWLGTNEPYPSGGFSDVAAPPSPQTRFGIAWAFSVGGATTPYIRTYPISYSSNSEGISPTFAGFPRIFLSNGMALGHLAQQNSSNAGAFSSYPNMKSAVLLDNPVTKTSSDTLKITYEFSYSP